jgi:hypothetical protein
MRMEGDPPPNAPPAGPEPSPLAGWIRLGRMRIRDRVEQPIRGALSRALKRLPRTPEWADDAAEAFPPLDFFAVFAAVIAFIVAVELAKETWLLPIAGMLAAMGFIVSAADWRARYLREAKGDRRGSTRWVAVILLTFLVFGSAIAWPVIGHLKTTVVATVSTHPAARPTHHAVNRAPVKVATAPKRPVSAQRSAPAIVATPRPAIVAAIPQTTVAPTPQATPTPRPTHHPTPKPTPAPVSTPQDPDALYQLGAKVGEVQGAVTDLSTGTVTFQMISSAMNLNVSENVEYRNYVLHIEHYGGEAGNHPNGIWLERRLLWVSCKIVGANQR